MIRLTRLAPGTYEYRDAQVLNGLHQTPRGMVPGWCAYFGHEHKRSPVLRTLADVRAWLATYYGESKCA